MSDWRHKRRTPLRLPFSCIRRIFQSERSSISTRGASVIFFYQLLSLLPVSENARQTLTASASLLSATGLSAPSDRPAAQQHRSKSDRYVSLPRDQIPSTAVSTSRAMWENHHDRKDPSAGRATTSQQVPRLGTTTFAKSLRLRCTTETLQRRETDLKGMARPYQTSAHTHRGGGGAGAALAERKGGEKEGEGAHTATTAVGVRTHFLKRSGPQVNWNVSVAKARKNRNNCTSGSGT